MTKFFSLMSLLGLFSVLCFTQCKKKNDGQDKTLFPISEATLTGATYGWTLTGLTADKPINPSVPTSTDWYKELGYDNLTFMFNTNKSYTLSDEIIHIPISGAWSLNDANTALTFGGLTIKFTESTDTKIVGTIVYPKYGVKQNEIANLTITLTKRTQSFESEFPLFNTYWTTPAGDYIRFYTLEASADYNGVPYELNYTYDSKTSTGTATDESGTVFKLSISGNQLTLTSDLIRVVFTKQ